MPGSGGTQRLPRLVGARIAMEMMLGGEPVSAARALELGILDRLVDGPDLARGATTFLRELISLQEGPRPLRAVELHPSSRRSAGLLRPARGAGAQQFDGFGPWLHYRVRRGGVSPALRGGARAFTPPVRRVSRVAGVPRFAASVLRGAGRGGWYREKLRRGADRGRSRRRYHGQRHRSEPCHFRVRGRVDRFLKGEPPTPGSSGPLEQSKHPGTKAA